jgi:O-antigen ligase
LNTGNGGFGLPLLEEPPAYPALPPGAARGLDRFATVVLALGLIAVVVIALPYKPFELDRYFVPKELVLHIVALILLVAVMSQSRVFHLDAADRLLALFLVLSAVSALFATNHWLAQRALAVSVSSAIVFWSARRLGVDSRRPLMIAAGMATLCAAGSALAQAYGIESEYFTLARAPGGTLGNRNFMAHIAGIGLPAIAWSTVTARRSIGTLVGSVSGAVVAAALVLSRSRAAWLAVAVSAAVLVLPVLASRKYWESQQARGRAARLVLAMAVGGLLAVALPNRLNWNSESPYLDSARGVVDFRKGSGRGRVAQYRNTLRMASAHPLLGVGPGNWPVKYVQFALPSDKSLTDDGMTANPWPSSDWAAFVSERGFVAAIALFGAFAAIFFGAFRGWSTLTDGDAVLARLALIGTLAAAMIVSAFDASLLLAAPALIVWTVLGAAAGIRRSPRVVTMSPRTRTIAMLAAVFFAAISVARSATQVVAMDSVGRGGRTAGWVAAAAWDPGSYRINFRVAELYARRGRCNAARPYARRAAQLFPSAPAAKRILRQCGRLRTQD